MLGKLKQLISGLDAAKDDAAEENTFVDDSTLSQQRLVAMDLAERERQIEILENEVQRLNTGQENVLNEALNRKLASFFSDLSGPVSHLLTQIHLVDKQGRDVNSKDTLRLVKQLLRQLEEAGLMIDSAAGAEVEFDPNHHEPLSSDRTLNLGDKVDVRVPGLAFDGHVLRKAGVAASEA